MNFGSKLNKVKLQADRIFQRTDKTDVIGDLREAEEQIEELRVLSEAFSRSLEKRLNTYSVIEEKKHKKVPENQFADTLKEALKEVAQNQYVEQVEKPYGLIRTTVEEIAAVEQLLGKELLDYEEQVDADILTPLHKILKDDFPSLAKQKKALKQAGQDVGSAKSKFRNSQANMSQPNKLETCREELEECESKLEQIRDAYACDLFAVLSKQREMARLSTLFLEAKLDYFEKSLSKLNKVLPPIRKMLENCPCSPAYGVPLHEHLRLNQQEIALPIVVCVRRMIEVGLREEGLLRMAGSTTKIKRLKGLFDAGLIDIETTFSSDYNKDYDTHVFAGAFKSYLRELPEPLLTHVKHDALIEAVRKQDHEEKLRSLWQVINGLPHQNYNNLKYVIKFLAMIASYSSENKMTFNNLAIVMAPNLIGGNSTEEVEILALGRNMSLGNDYRLMIEQLIEYSDYFFKGDVDFGVQPKNPEPPPSPRLNSSVNGFTRTGSHKRTGSADFNTIAGPPYPECESPKQPHRIKKKPAPLPPQGKTFEESCSSPEQTRSKTPPTISPANPSLTNVMSTSVGPLPAPRLHHSNSIRRPTAEPPKPPGVSIPPVKPPRPSPPQVVFDEIKPPRPNPPLVTCDSADSKVVPIGFEKLDSDKPCDSSEPTCISAPKSPVKLVHVHEGGPAPLGFAALSTEELSENVEVREKKTGTLVDSDFRKSLEGVLKHQPQAQPRHLLRNTTTDNVSAVVEQKTGFQLPTFPVPCQRSTKDGMVERPEPIARADKPAVPDKPSVIKSIVSVEHSRPMVPEKPLLKGSSATTETSNQELESTILDEQSLQKNPTENDATKPNKPPKPNKPSVAGRISSDPPTKSLESSTDQDISMPVLNEKKGDSTQL